MSVHLPRGRKVRLSAASSFLALALSQPSFAHQDDAPNDHTSGTVDYDYARYQTPQYAAFELRIGPYTPRIDSEFATATPYADAFDGGRAPTFGFEGSWQALRIPYFGTLGPGLGVHWFRKQGIAPFSDPDAPEESAHRNSLWIMPMYAVAVLRVDVLSRELHIPLVPYVKGGFAWAIWESRDAQSVSVIEGTDGSVDKARGIETGLQGQVGLMFHLNPLAPQAAVNMDTSAGVNNAYLFAELWWSSINSFGNGMQVGAQTWVGGLAIEY